MKAVQNRRDYVCGHPGCVTPGYAKGLCEKHYIRQRVHGSSDIVKRRPGGVDHECWTGDDATYQAAHKRTRRVRGSARRHVCHGCGERPAFEWSYRHDDPAEKVSPKGYRYSPDPAHYDPMCTSCHRLADARKEAA